MSVIPTPTAYLITPGLLGLGIGLAAVPIVIHLLSRRRVRKVRWAAMNWLMAAMKRHQRRLRMENWLILLLRVTAIVILGLALARPVLQDSTFAGLVANKRSVYLVLDNSYSVEAKLQARSVLERMKYEADLVLKSIGADDAIAVIVTNDPEEDVSDGLDPHVLLGRSVGGEGPARARETVAALRARHAVANWAQTLDSVQGQMTDQDVNRNVIIVTDLQAKDWLQGRRERIAGERVAGDTAGPAGGADAAGRMRKQLIRLLRRPAKVRIIDVGGTDRRDLAVMSVGNRTGQEPFVGRPLQLAVTVANYGARPVTGALLEVRIDDGARKQSYPVPPLPGADTGMRVPRPALETVQVNLGRGTFQRPGSHSIQFSVVPPREDPGADSLALSSKRWMALNVRRRIHVLAWSETSGTERDMDAELYLRAIYEGVDPGEGGTSLDEGLPPIYAYASANREGELLSRLQGRDPVDLVVLANVAPRDERVITALREFVAAGGGLLVFTGDRRKEDQLNAAFFSDDPETRLLPLAFERAQVRKRGDPTDDAEGAYMLDLSFQEEPHPLATPFTNVKADDWIKKYPPAIWGRTTFREPDAAAEEPTPTPSDGDGATNGGAAKPIRAGRIVLRFRDGRAAVVSNRFGDGRTIWVGTSIDNGWLARAGALFLPVFLDEAALYLTRSDGAGRNLAVGGVLRSRLPAAASKVRIVPPGGGAVSPTRTTPERTDASRVRYEYDGVGRSGIWQLTYELPSADGDMQDARELFAVNPEAEEGSLLPASPGALRDGIPAELDLAFLPSYADVSSVLEEAREGEITRYLLWILIAVLLLESFLALKFGRRGTQQEEAPGA